MSNARGTVGASVEQRRLERLHAIARGYVTEGLGKGNFDAIPYHEDVELRAPLCPGGSAVPLVGREVLRTNWWPPLRRLVEHVEVLDTFVDANLSAAAVEFRLTTSMPPCELRVLDRLAINPDGEIVAQSSFFDPRPLTHAAATSSQVLQDVHREDSHGDEH
jgi:hypothetical protein